jgi:molybdopterin molybdotransferase
MTRVLDFEEALGVVATQAGAGKQLGTALVPLLEALGRVLAEPVLADRDQPPFDRATRDGFAVRAADWRIGARLRVMGEVRAGEVWGGVPVQEGECLAIMTGAPMPDGADAVVMVEHTRRDGDWVQPDGVDRTTAPGGNVVQRGAEATSGAIVVSAGTRVSAADVALAATCGCAMLRVFAKPLVAILATGDELVEVTESPAEQQIRNSNSYAIAAMVSAAGGDPMRLTIARDRREDLHARIAEGREADLLLLSGGVSMGEYDLVEEVVLALGAEFFFTGVRMQPGRPVVFGRLPATEAGNECLFFGLPGNPISTQVTFHCFVEPLLRWFCGEARVAPKWALARLSETVVGRAGLTRLLPARLEGTEFGLIPWHGSGDLAANGRANCYAEFLPGKDALTGEVVRVLLR